MGRASRYHANGLEIRADRDALAAEQLDRVTNSLGQGGVRRFLDGLPSHADRRVNCVGAVVGLGRVRGR